MINKIYGKLTSYLDANESICLLDGDLKDYFSPQANNKELRFVIPLCPDYSFELKNESERIHDFTSLGDDIGIVYSKLISYTNPFFQFLANENIRYTALFLMADVEAADQIVLTKIGLNAKEFLAKTSKSIEKINTDLKTKNINGRCIGMRDFYSKNKYDFFGEIKKNVIKLQKDNMLKDFIKKVIDLRVDLYKFWFGIGQKQCIQRAYDDVAMYSAFTTDPVVAKSIILCADSEILSQSYNILKKNNKKVPVLYVRGAY